MRIAGKLTLGFGVVVFLLVGLVVSNLAFMSRMKAIQDAGFQRSADSLATMEAQYAPIRAYRVVADLIINRNLSASSLAWTNEKARIRGELDRLAKMTDTDKEKAWLAQTESAFASFVDLFEKHLVPAATATTGISAEIIEIDATFDGIVDAFSAPLASIGASIFAEQVQGDRDFDAYVKEATLYSFILAMAAFLASVILAFLITRSITNPLAVAVEHADLVSGGDLTKDIPAAYLGRKDEIGRLAKSLDGMIRSLRDLVTSVQDAAGSVEEGSREIASTAELLSQGASEQASGLEEVSASIEEMASSIRQSSDNSQATEAIARKSAEGIKGGATSVGQAVAAMRDIAAKIGIIEEIARQTNLLALNAAIEAARAGESGKGFAVVASEVRKLAERSQVAAGEISSLSSTSVAVADQAGKLILEVVPEIGKTADLVAEVSAASREQSAGTGQISSAVTQLDSIVQQNANVSEEMASMAEELAGQAETLIATLAHFKVRAGEGEGAVMALPPARA
jgi:methyl-accepting chemotaxis protein